MDERAKQLTADEVVAELKLILAKAGADNVSREKTVYEMVGFMTAHRLSRVDIFTQIYDLASELEIGAEYIMRFDEKWVVLVDLILNFDPEKARKYARTHVS
ncbi:MAG: hypothetical protein HZA25_03080 [Candidatus Niyogibacteria bacterium]|nr:hypothetical protein [Candidatus Niyogibacteria bacterium]